MKIGIIDYGMGNICSVINAVKYICEYDVSIVSDPADIKKMDCLILPGVGAFMDAMKNIKKRGLLDPINELVMKKERPILAICLGMQLLFEFSEEGGKWEGLGWIQGHVKRFDIENSFRVPHIGWNDVEIKNNNCLFSGIDDDSNFYFVHSYHVVSNEVCVAATCRYGYEFIAAIQKKNIIGTQFHPEKSHHNGFIVLNNFLKYAAEYS